MTSARVGSKESTSPSAPSSQPMAAPKDKKDKCTGITCGKGQDCVNGKCKYKSSESKPNQNPTTTPKATNLAGCGIGLNCYTEQYDGTSKCTDSNYPKGWYCCPKGQKVIDKIKCM